MSSMPLPLPSAPAQPLPPFATAAAVALVITADFLSYTFETVTVLKAHAGSARSSRTREDVSPVGGGQE